MSNLQWSCSSTKDKTPKMTAALLLCLYTGYSPTVVGSICNSVTYQYDRREPNYQNKNSLTISIDQSNQMDFQSKLEMNIQKLHKIANYKYGEKENIVIPNNYLQFTREILEHLGDMQPEVFPTAGGDIQLEYENSSTGKYLEFVVFRNHNMNVFRIDEAGNETEETDIPFDINTILSEVNNFYV